jgi:hypothetical protein
MIKFIDSLDKCYTHCLMRELAVNKISSAVAASLLPVL